MLPWLLACLPLPTVIGATDLDGRALLLSVAVLGVTALTIRALPAWLPAVAAAATIGLTAVTDITLGWRLGILVIIPLCFWMIATGACDPPYRWMPDGRLFRPCLFPVALATIALVRDEGNLRRAAVLLAVACLAAIVVVIVPGAVDRMLHRLDSIVTPATRAFHWVEGCLATVGRMLGRVIGVLIMLPVTVLLLLRWVTQRIFGDDPLATPRSAPGEWARRSGQDPDPHRLFSGATTVGTPELGRSVRRFASTAMSVGVVAALVMLALPTSRDQAATTAAKVGVPVGIPPEDECPAQSDPAMEHDPGWPDFLCDTARYSLSGRFSAVTTYTMSDFASPNVNVVHGVRRTWHAPECGCRRVRMWMFGGSAAFGWWQRDDVSLASQIARRAWEHGIALDIEVRANPGWVLGQEQRLFDQMTVTSKVLPDVALFYDGGNDLNRQFVRNQEGRGADESETSFTEEDIDKLLRQGPFPWRPPEAAVSSASTTPGAKPLPPEATARHAMNRYIRGLELVRRTASASGIHPILVWQPLLVAAGKRAGNPNAMPPDSWDTFTRMLATARPLIPSDVIDLSDVLDGVDHPVFKDLFHHNVAAAVIISAALFDRIEPELRKIAGA